MISIFLGFFAGLCWSCHDLLARRVAGPIGPFRLGALIMLAGALLLVVPALWSGDLLAAPRGAVFMALAMGVVYAAAAAALFLALTLAPVSIVGPIVGGYPALVVVWGLVNGLEPTLLQWLCIVIIMVGVVIVARAEQEGEGHSDVLPGKLPVVLVAAAVASVCYAATAVMGQHATQSMGALETTFISRFPAAIVMLLLMLVQRQPKEPIGRSGWAGIFGMAAFDISAVTAINASTHFPNPELGAMAISGSSATSVLLAVWILKEKVTPMQWVGVIMVVAGVAGLAAPA